MNTPVWKHALVACSTVLLCGSMAAAQNNVEAPAAEPGATVLPPTPVGVDEPGLAQQNDPTRFRYTLTREDYKNDWRQAGEGEDRLGERFRTHIVRLTEAQAVKGQLAAIEGSTGELKGAKDVSIRFIRNGKVQKTVVPEADGSFTAEGLEPGVYSVIGAGKEGFFAWSIDVRGNRYELTMNSNTRRTGFGRKPVASKIQSAVIQKQDFGQLRTLMRNYLPTQETTQFVDGPDVPPEMRSRPPASAYAGTSLKHHEVRLTPDGHFIGRVRRLQSDSGRDLRIRQLNVYLIKNNKTVAQQAVASNGTFSFVGVKPGVYSVAAIGRDGFFALSIDLLKARKTDGAAMPASTASVLPKFGLCFDVALCPPINCNPVNVDSCTGGFMGGDQSMAMAQELPLIQDVPMVDGMMGPMSGGFSSPIMMGGGGGAAVGAGGGGIAGLLIGGGVGALLFSDDDDSRRQTSSPASP